jgi:hypothetical protein
MVLGLLASALFSGTMVSKTGKYKIYPIVGSFVIAVGLFLLSLMDEHTNVAVSSVYMAVLGLGVGLAMQVPLIAVQNSTDYADLGVATSGVTFLRTMGSSFGAAIFGTIYANQLPKNLSDAAANIKLPPGATPPPPPTTPEALHSLPSFILDPLVHAYAISLQTVFLAAAPVGLLAFVVAFFLKQVKLRDSARATATELSESLPAPRSADSDAELERAMSALWHDREKDAAPDILSRADVTMNDAEAWLLLQIYRHGKDDGDATLRELSNQSNIPAGIFEPTCLKLVEDGYLVQEQGHFRFSGKGEDTFTRLIDAWRGWLTDQLADWAPERHAELTAAVDRMARKLAAETGDMTARAVPA